VSGGIVHLVGAGPGDPDLLTVGGARALASADVVVHDRLGTEQLLPLCRAGAELLNAGKSPDRHAMSQDEINAALVEHGLAGRRVVRLKGGDPFVFGRGSEEAQALAAAGVPYVVVPGITSAIAAPAYAGIPVTHRGLSTSFTVVTGHEDPTKPSEQTDWAALARVPGTLVILMGMGRLGGIADALIAGGRAADEPAAAIQWGTTPRQRHLVATLSTLAGRVEAEGLGSPAVVVVGPVAGLAPSIGWLERRRPLLGRTVVVTRARAQASLLTERLRALGAEVVELPAIRIEPIAASPAIDAAMEGIGDYRLVVLTSVNGVDALFARLAERGRDARALSPEATVVAIGPATAERLAARGVRADLVPGEYVAEGILDALAGRPLEGVRALVARARGSRPALVDGLRARGAVVDEVELYESVSEPADPAVLAAALAAGHLTFTASSTVRSFMALLDAGQRAALGRGPRVVSIGPITSATARDEGLEVHAEAAEFTIPGLVEALLADVAGAPAAP
jgi:uroporphyrinogen III methyltransferase/synthase